MPILKVTQKGCYSAKITSWVGSIVRIESKESLAFEDYSKKRSLPNSWILLIQSKFEGKCFKEMKTFPNRTLTKIIEEQGAGSFSGALSQSSASVPPCLSSLCVESPEKSRTWQEKRQEESATPPSTSAGAKRVPGNGNLEFERSSSRLRDSNLEFRDSARARASGVPIPPRARDSGRNHPSPPKAKWQQGFPQIPIGGFPTRGFWGSQNSPRPAAHCPESPAPPFPGALKAPRTVLFL